MKPILLLLGSLVLLALVFLSGVIITANVIAEPEPHKFANIDTPDLWTSQPKEVDAASQVLQRLPDAPQPQAAVAEAPKPAQTASQPASEAAAAPPAAQPDRVALDNIMTASVGAPAPIPAMPAPPSQPLPQPQAAGNMVEPVPPQNPNVDAAHAQFCFARYRSYRVEDNTYQPFDGGPRRQCQTPGAPQVEASAPAAQAPIARDVASAPVSAASRMRVQDKQRDLPPLPPEAIPTDDEWQAVESGQGESSQGDPQVMESAAPAGSGEAGSHKEWCANRYQSYRADDDSYQPFDGSPRRTCQSPFG